MQSRDTCGRSLSDGRGGSVVALEEGPKRNVLPESQQPGEAFSRENDAVPLCCFTWLLMENTQTSYRETFTSAFLGQFKGFLTFQRSLNFHSTTERPPVGQKTPGRHLRRNAMTERPKTGWIYAEARMDSPPELVRHWPPPERSPEVFKRHLTHTPTLKQGWQSKGWQNLMGKNNSDEIQRSKLYQSNQWKHRLDAKPVKPGGSQCNVEIFLGHLSCCVNTPLHAEEAWVWGSVQVLPGDLS